MFQHETKDGRSDQIATVHFSGGIDSMVCAHLLISQGYEVSGVFVDYGQPAAKQERRAAEALPEALSIQALHYCTAKALNPIGCGEVVGRNAFLIFSAVTLAGVRRGLLSMGIHAGTSYYDCSPDFCLAVSDLLAGYTDGCLRFSSPLIDWKKPEIVAYARAEGLPLELTYSCEAGTDPPCGKCLSCLDRRSIGC